MSKTRASLSTRRRSSGFTIIELGIALSIMAVMIIGGRQLGLAILMHDGAHGCLQLLQGQAPLEELAAGEVHHQVAR